MSGILRVLLLVIIAAQAPAQDLRGAREFVQHIYSRYGSSTLHSPDFLGKDAKSVFSPSLLHLIVHEQANTPPGYVGMLDFDPICGCQDPDGLKLANLNLTATTPERSLAIVTLRFSEPSSQIVRLSLFRTSKGWRIDDVASRGMSSLRQLLCPK